MKCPILIWLCVWLWHVCSGLLLEDNPSDVKQRGCNSRMFEIRLKVKR
jgi:hypothetical protein